MASVPGAATPPSPTSDSDEHGKKAPTGHAATRSAYWEPRRGHSVACNIGFPGSPVSHLALSRDDSIEPRMDTNRHGCSERAVPVRADSWRSPFGGVSDFQRWLVLASVFVSIRAFLLMVLAQRAAPVGKTERVTREHVSLLATSPKPTQRTIHAVARLCRLFGAPDCWIAQYLTMGSPDIVNVSVARSK